MGAKLSGSSGKRYAIDQNADINVTPFVDVMLVLLIIFMVAAPLATQSLKIDLPPPSVTPPKVKVQLVLIQIQDNGDIYVGIRDKSQNKTTLDALPGAVVGAWAEAQLTGDQQKVTIATSDHVKYGEFMDVLNSLEKNGITKIGLALNGQ